MPVGSVGVGVASKDLDPLVEQGAGSTRVFESQAGLGRSEPGATSLYANELKRRISISSQRRPRWYISRLGGTHPAVASVAAILLLITICRATKSRAVQPRSARRRLSDDWGSTDSGVQTICRSVAGVPDSGSSTEPFEPRAQRDPSAPIPKIMKLDTEVTGRAPTSQSTHQGQLQSEANAALFSSSQSKHRSVIPSSGSLTGQAGNGTPLHAQQYSGAPENAAGLAASVRSADEFAAASGLLSLHAQNPASAEVHHPVLDPSQPSEQRHRSNDVGQCWFVSSDSARTTKPDANNAFPVVLTLLTAPHVIAVVQQNDTQQSPQPSTSTTALQQTHECRPVACDCRFFRLPEVQEPGAHRKRFDASRATSMPAHSRRHVNYYEPLALLLSRKSLSPTEMDFVVGLTEILVSCIIENEGKQPHATQRIIEMLGRRFLVLDAIVSALQILDVPRGRWWEQITTRVPHRFPIPHLRRLTYAEEDFIRNLIGELTSAIDILKSGTRPPAEQLIRVKTMLFFDHRSPRELRLSRWNVYREGYGCA